MISQCAMLEEFGIFLVLADKACGGWFQLIGMSLMTPVVALCLPHRSACAFVTWSSERFANTPET
jgi:hypothetical protein